MSQVNDHSLSYLDDIPDAVYQRLITHAYRSNKRDSLRSRCYGVITLSRKLFSGEEVSQEDFDGWLLVDHAAQVYQAISSDNIQNIARGNQSVVNEIIVNLLDWLDKPVNRLSFRHYVDKDTPYSSVSDFSGDQNPHKNEADNNKVGNDISGIDKLQYKNDFHVPQDNNSLPEDSELALLSNEDLDQALHKLNRRFGFQRQLGWDLSRGVSAGTDLRMILRLHSTIKSSRYLQSIINLIGRKKISRHDIIQQQGLNIENRSEQGKSYQLPDEHSVDSVSGIVAGDDVCRMLPSQLAMLGHPQLNLLWHAKRAEQQLLNYHIRGVLSEHIPQVDAVSIDSTKTGTIPILQQGPMIVCIDTSASMKGRSEYIAKAVALECMRVAKKTGRGCYLISFSGGDELSAMSIDIPVTGWQPVLDFVNASFHGGTDIEGVLVHALSRLNTPGWQNADLLLVSDGRFNLTDSNVVIKQLEAYPHVRLFGIQVSRWSAAAFGDICHRVFNFAHV